MPESSRPKRILVFTCQPVYIPGAPATGSGLRAFGIGQGLRDRGHEVIFSEPEGAPGNGRDAPGSGRKHNARNIPEIIASVGPDVVIFGNWGLADRSPQCDVPTVVDINGSLILENYYRKGFSLFEDMLGKIKALGKVDLVLAGSFRQKMFLASWCLMAGLRPESIRIEVMPFSLPPALPTPAPPEEPVFVMAGYRWPWLAGQEVVETVSRELDRMRRGVLKIYTSSPCYNDIFPGEASLGDRRGILDVAGLPRVELHGLVPFDALTGILSRSTVGLDIWQENMERALAVSTRAVVYLWCGLPVITNEGSGLAGRIKAYGAGWTVVPRDAGEIARRVRDIVDNPGVLEGPRAGAVRLVRDHFTWDRSIGVLDDFCRFPSKNRNASPFLKLRDLLESANRDLESANRDLESANRGLESVKRDLDERVGMMTGEASLMGEVHRRPRGLEVLFSRNLFRHRVRRWTYEVPVLAYLFALAFVGEYLMGLRERWGPR